MLKFNDFLYTEFAAKHVEAQKEDDRKQFDIETDKLLADLKRYNEGKSKSKYSFTTPATNVIINEPDTQEGHKYITGEVKGPKGNIVKYTVSIPEDKDWRIVKEFDILVDGKKVQGLKYKEMERSAAYLQYALKQAIFGTRGAGAGARKINPKDVITALQTIINNEKIMEIIRANKSLAELAAILDQIKSSEEVTVGE